MASYNLSWLPAFFLADIPRYIEAFRVPGSAALQGSGMAQPHCRALEAIENSRRPPTAIESHRRPSKVTEPPPEVPAPALPERHPPVAAAAGRRPTPASAFARCAARGRTRARTRVRGELSAVSSRLHGHMRMGCVATRVPRCYRIILINLA